MTVSMVKINQVVDFLERVVWTAIQAAAGSALVVLTDGHMTWGAGAKVIGIAAAIAALKVVIAQRMSPSGLGDISPGKPVIQTEKSVG